ncbi:LegC family aminotransferase [Thalassospira sp. MCCC 1A03138]|uniref:LegC family aminotransferase n=1 Tax=Thalassospira sp. MCCC 1A03138 TaxID=1470576 RepID=UPI00111C5FA7|nr:LegC family aminotransferase [Thalassospira sp. MCCC 1A03138]
MQASIANSIVAALQQVLGVQSAALHEPRFGGNEWRYLKECLDSTFVSSVGKFVDRLEADLADYTGSAYAVAVVNGTSALHIALMLAGVRQGDEVLLPSLTFVATANAASYCGAVPHFVDSEIATLGIDANRLRQYLSDKTEMTSGLCINRETGRVIRALVPMHCFGHPGDIDGLLAVARDFNIVMVEDAAESLGSWYGHRHTGTFGKLGTLSFNGNKTITTGGGGAILTQDLELAKLAKHMTTTAKQSHVWEYSHDMVGYNYRMPNINAALGCAQLEQLPELINAKRRLYQAYEEAFAEVAGVELFREPAGSQSNYWLQTLLLSEDNKDQRDAILSATNTLGLMTRPAWTLMHRLPAYEGCPRMASLSVAENLADRIINIPSGSALGMGLD